MTHKGLIQIYIRYIQICKDYYRLEELPEPIRTVREISYADDLFAKAAYLTLFADGFVDIDKNAFKVEIYRIANEAVGAKMR